MVVPAAQPPLIAVSVLGPEPGLGLASCPQPVRKLKFSMSVCGVELPAGVNCPTAMPAVASPGAKGLSLMLTPVSLLLVPGAGAAT